MVRQIVLLLAIVLGLAGLSYVDACEQKCRSEPVNYLTKKYKALLDHLAEVYEPDHPETVELVKDEITEIVKAIGGPDGVIDGAIFNTFKGSCKDPPGKRRPDDLCGSAKSIACFAPWGHSPSSVFQMVHDAVTLAVKKRFDPEFKVIVDGLESSCPGDCQDWVEKFQSIMLRWEKEEHPEAYSEIPNCLPLDHGGI